MAPSATQLGKVAIGSADPVDTFLNWADFDPGVSQELRDFNATRGTFYKDGNRVVPVRTRVLPRYSSTPTASELAAVLAWATGGTPTGSNPTTYPFADAAAVRNVFFAPKQGESWFLGGVGVDTMTLTAAVGEGLRCDLELVGRTYDDTRSDFPAGLGPDQTTRPFVLSNLVLVVAGVTRKTREFTFTLRNNIDRERYLNSLTLTDTLKLDQMTTVSIDVPSGDNTGLWKLGAAGVTLVATFTNAGAGVLTLTFTDVRFGPNSPTHPSRAEGFLRLEGESYRTGTGSPATITLTVGA